MSSLLPIKARTELARSLFRDIVNVNDYFYVYFGHTQPWSLPTEIPPLITDTLLSNNTIRKNMMAVKRINPTDVVYMVKRVDWTTGTIYDRFDDVVDLSTKNFYVFNASNSCIYKCVNRQDYIDGSPVVASTVPPSNASAENFSTADGYWWRLIYSVPAADTIKFLTSSFIPVRFFSSSTNFNCSGVIEGATIQSGGSGYITPPTIIINGDGKGASAIATINDGTVTSVSIINAGSGYTWATITFVSTTGTGAKGTVILEDIDPPDGLNVAIAASAQANAGSIDFIDILSPNGSGRGANYTPETIFTMVGDGENVTLLVTFVEGGTGNINSITTGNKGQQYTLAAVATAGAGEGALLKPILTPIYGHGGNVPAELLATTVAVSVDVTDSLTDFFLNNDFRQAGIIKNLHAYGTLGDIYTKDTGDASYTIQVSDVGNYHDDDAINTDSGGLFTVIQISGNLVKLLPVIDIISETSVLFNVTTSGTLAPIVANSIVFPEINTKTGDIIYVQNFLPIERQAGQTETPTFIMNF
jgi:hypothetical protein